MVEKPRRRHHVVSRFYLQHFADGDGQLMTVELPGDRQFSQNVKNVSVHKDYYTVLDNDGEPSDQVEKAFGKIETPAASAWMRVAEGGWPLGSNDREVMAGWIALQLLRGESVRTSMGQIGTDLLRLQIMIGGRTRLREVLRESGEPHGEIAVNEAWIDLFANPFEMEPHANHHLQHLVNTLPRVVEGLLDRWWLLTTFKRKRLATCDHPVAVIPNERDRALGMGTGIETADVIGLPLNRHASLALARRDSLPDELARRRIDGLKPGVSLTALYSNDVTAKNARRYIYHHPDDSPLDGLTLPQPREREISNPGDPWRFMSDDDKQVLIEAGVERPPRVPYFSGEDDNLPVVD